MAEPAPPSATVRIGMTVPQLADAFPGRVHPADMTDDAPVTVTTPVSLTILAGSSDLVLPPTRFVMVSQATGVVYGVDTSPMLEFGSLAACHDLASHLVGTVGASGWTLGERYTPTLPDMQAVLAEPGRMRFEQTYAAFHTGPATLRLYVREMRGAGPDGQAAPPGTLFLVNVDVVDEVLHGTLMERMFARRQASGAGTGTLPLRAWLSGGP